jgi:hypothetical protein
MKINSSTTGLHTICGEHTFTDSWYVCEMGADLVSELGQDISPVLKCGW